MKSQISTITGVRSAIAVVIYLLNTANGGFLTIMGKLHKKKTIKLVLRNEHIVVVLTTAMAKNSRNRVSIANYTCRIQIYTQKMNKIQTLRATRPPILSRAKISEQTKINQTRLVTPYLKYHCEVSFCIYMVNLYATKAQ